MRLFHVLAVLTAFLCVGADFPAGLIDGTVLRPVQVDAQVKGCKVSKPGEYTVTVGDLIEIEYTFPVTPETTPKRFEVGIGIGEEVKSSPLGIRRLDNGLLGTRTIVLFLTAVEEGKGGASMNIDKATYSYQFNVRPKK